jgi:hypothetical protein
MQLTKYGPKGHLSPSLGDTCPLCGVALAAGDFTTLVRRTANGKYANDGVEVHWDCAQVKWPRGTDHG